MNLKWILSGLVCGGLSVLLAGCDGSKPSPPTPKADAPAEKSTGESKPEAKQETGLAGKWHLELVEEGTARDFAVIEISPPDPQGKQTVATLVMAASFDAAKLKSSAVKGDSLEMIYNAGDDVTLEFHARRTEQGVKGSLLIPKILGVPVQFVKTDAETLENKPEGEPLPDAELLQKVASSPDAVDALNDFIQKHPGSPLLLNAYPILLAHLKNTKAKQEEVEKLHADMLKTAELWGGPVKVRASLDLASILARLQFFPDLAKAYLDEFQKQLQPNYPANWTTELALARVQLGQSKEAIALLTSAPKGGPQDILLNYVLARAYEADKQPSQALDLYAKLAVVPFMEQMLVESMPEVSREKPTQAAERIWKEIHKSDNGLDKFFEETYEKEIAALTPARDKIPPRPQNARVALLELFTGTSCPPCVAADITMSGIHHHYKPDEVIVLKYHEHIPAPDPFASEMTAKRFTYYQLEGTPMGALDGKVEEHLSGYSIQAPARYQNLRQQIDPGLQRTTPMQIELSGVVNQGKLKIKANVVGESLADDLRLRLAIVENGIHFKAPNGIRLHDCVVRTMPGGVEGIAPKDKKLAFETEIVLADLKSSLERETARLEEKIGQLFAQPVALKNLQLAAFVQDEHSKEVLQAKLIDIAGMEGTAPATPEKAPEKAPEKKPEAKPADKPAETNPPEKPAEKPADAKPASEAPPQKITQPK
ncbi:MAG: hypothetical protein U0903_10180 [Planctomycetales bacterium]